LAGKYRAELVFLDLELRGVLPPQNSINRVVVSVRQWQLLPAIVVCAVSREAVGFFFVLLSFHQKFVITQTNSVSNSICNANFI
jgi:hypothetical protein